RRRHTRFSRDWSSDVCSSDLLQPDCSGWPVQAITNLVLLHKTHAVHPVQSDSYQSRRGNVPVTSDRWCWLLRPDGAELQDDHQYSDVDRKSTRLNSSHVKISYAVFCLKKKNKKTQLHKP